MPSPSRKTRSRSPLEYSKSFQALSASHKNATKKALDEAGVMKNYLKGFSPLTDSKQISPVKSSLSKFIKNAVGLVKRKGGKKSRKSVVKRGGKNRTHKKK